MGGVLGLALIVGAVGFLTRRRFRTPAPPPKPHVQLPLELSTNYLSEAPTHAGGLKRNELAGPPVSRPELSGSKGSYYELGGRL